MIVFDGVYCGCCYCVVDLMYGVWCCFFVVDEGYGVGVVLVDEFVVGVVNEVDV